MVPEVPHTCVHKMKTRNFTYIYFLKFQNNEQTEKTKSQYNMIANSGS